MEKVMSSRVSVIQQEYDIMDMGVYTLLGCSDPAHVDYRGPVQ